MPRGRGLIREYHPSPQKEESPDPQELEFELGWWDTPDALVASSEKPVTVSMLQRKLNAGKRKIDTVMSRVLKFAEQHKGQFRKIEVRANSRVIRLYGLRKETAEEVENRLRRVQRRRDDYDKFQRQQNLMNLQRLIKENPETVRRALHKHDRKQAEAAVESDPEVAREALEG